MNNEAVVKITGTIKNVRYYQSDFGIIQVYVDEIKEGEPQTYGNNMITVKGKMPEPITEEQYNIVAKTVLDSKWGMQYDVISICHNIDFAKEGKKGEKRFLSALFTPNQVENMYQALDNPFETLKNEDAQELVKVKGCGLRVAERWIRKFKKNYSLSLILTELADYNFTDAMIKKLMKTYKSPDLIVEKIKNNPYVLCEEVDGIGWKTADKIALRGGMDEFDTRRISGYIYKYLSESGEKGYSWITSDELMGEILDVFGDDIPDEVITNSIHSMEEKLWWNENKTKIGLKIYYVIENNIAKELLRIRDADTKITYSNWEKTIEEIEKAQGWNYTSEQKNGVKTALDNNVVLIQGLAGTGKSTLVSALIKILNNYEYVQCALSGRASSRMAEITGEEGYTIHRLLGFPKGDKNGYAFHDDNPLPQDIIIVDEISMINSFLFYYLLRAIKDGAKIILLGDQGQLESIGSGNIIHDIIYSHEIPVVSLTQIHRQAEASAIITESIKIRNGEQIIPKDWSGIETRGELQDLTFNCFSDITNTYYKIMQAFSEVMNTPDFNINQTQVIVPVKNQGASSTYELNNSLQELYNPKDTEKIEVTIYNNDSPYILREGDKVINVVNNYKSDPVIYNGNMGIIDSITKDYDEEEEIYIDNININFQGIGLVAIPKDCWKNIQLGYAITVHKSQGSQWDNVIVGIDFSSYSLLTRELIYTAITRSKKHCSLIAQTGALRMAIHNEQVSQKQTHLAECIYNLAHPKLIF